MKDRLKRLFGGRRSEQKLEKAIGYRFRRPALLEMALIHRSHRYENPGMAADNQRLEFLGDAVLGLLAAAHVYEKFADRDEGMLTTLRSQMTSGQALARVAAALELGRHLKMGKGEEQTDGRNRPSTLADALEAVIGAAYLDGGMRACQRIFRVLFLPATGGLEDDHWASNPKGKLQEYCQRRWKCGPQYRLIRREGPAHATQFTVEVLVQGEPQGLGTATNKQDAEAEAALEALRALKGQK
jgi:ribonuclease III